MPTTVDAFRKFALALPGVVEGEHHSHPDFRLNGRIFASLHPNGSRAMVRLTPGADQERLIARDPAAWAPANGAWGRAGCMMVELAKAKRMVVAAALAEAWLAETARQASKQPASKQPATRQPETEQAETEQQPAPQPKAMPTAASEPEPKPKGRKRRKAKGRARRKRR